MSHEETLEYAIHDTFDALSPRYDNPIDPEAMRRIAEGRLHRPFEVAEHLTVTLLRTKLAAEGRTAG